MTHRLIHGGFSRNVMLIQTGCTFICQWHPRLPTCVSKVSDSPPRPPQNHLRKVLDVGDADQEGFFPNVCSKEPNKTHTIRKPKTWPSETIELKVRTQRFPFESCSVAQPLTKLQLRTGRWQKLNLQVKILSSWAKLYAIHPHMLYYCYILPYFT